MNKKDAFVIINSYFIGDILLTNSLVQNIKRIFPNAWIISLTSSELIDVAKYQEGVDEVIVWDRKNKHKSIWATLKFVWQFPYKNIHACFPIYGMDRPVLLSMLLGAHYVSTQPQKFFAHFIHTKYKVLQTLPSAQEQFMQYLTGITKEKLINVPIKYNVPECHSKTFLLLPEEYIILSTTSTRKSKEMPHDIACKIIEKLQDKKIVLLGQGNSASEFSHYIKHENFKNLIDLSNKTTILEAAHIIKNAKAMISVDTGLMHLACAVQTPVVAIFYEKDTSHYKPNEKLYKSKVISQEQTVDNIINNYKLLMEETL